MNPCRVLAGLKHSDRPSPVVTTPKIVQCNADFKVPKSGAEPFKDHLIGISAGTRSLLGGADRPGQERQAEQMPRDPGRRRRQIVDPIGDELRPGSQRVLEMPHARTLGRRRFGPIGLSVVALRNDASRPVRYHLAKRDHLVRIERHSGNRSGVGLEHFCHPFHEPAIAVEATFDLNNDRNASAHQDAEVGERHHLFARVLETNFLQRHPAQAEQGARALGEAAKFIVMMHHGFAVGSELDVAFDSEIRFDGSECRARHVFDDAARAIVQTAMGHRPRGQPVRRSHLRLSFFGPCYETSNTPSTSTAASAGSEETPTVVRAWRPLSPKAATIKSEAPLSTFGPSRKSGTELTKPPRRTTRTTLSRSPSAALTCARRLMAQPRAAAAPCSTLTFAPSLPLAISLPSAPRQTWPETNRRLPLRTKGT